ncbi:hypothetical protein NE237_001385 [Protea cynaroides]|uniref:Uncharacterized protein n=1 Tax=Protea cynaroides TaxID=273540 RepID=A0A9Q0KTE1_9MAGN|nr:hypothetical protein NE237_001385 [Protea cynaroides]
MLKELCRIIVKSCRQVKGVLVAYKFILRRKVLGHDSDSNGDATSGNAIEGNAPSGDEHRVRGLGFATIRRKWRCRGGKRPTPRRCGVTIAYSASSPCVPKGWVSTDRSGLALTGEVTEGDNRL